MGWIVVAVSVVSGLSIVYRAASVFVARFRGMGVAGLALATSGQGSLEVTEPVASHSIRQSLWSSWYASAPPLLKPIVILVNTVLTVVGVFFVFLNVYAIIADQLEHGFDLFVQWRAIILIAVAAAVLSFEDSRDSVTMLRMVAVVMANLLGISYLLASVTS
jgi:hypothetical protein